VGDGDEFGGRVLLSERADSSHDGAAKVSGSIANIASIASLVHGGDTYGYGVSKAGAAYLSASWQRMLHRIGFGSIGFTWYVNLNGDNFDVLAKGYCNTYAIVAQFFAPQ
jgi:hypothetical protein